jgi:hypothetical protein
MPDGDPEGDNEGLADIDAAVGDEDADSDGEVELLALIDADSDSLDVALIDIVGVIDGVGASSPTTYENPHASGVLYVPVKAH